MCAVGPLDLTLVGPEDDECRCDGDLELEPVLLEHRSGEPLLRQNHTSARAVALFVTARPGLFKTAHGGEHPLHGSLRAPVATVHPVVIFDHRPESPEEVHVAEDEDVSDDLRSLVESRLAEPFRKRRVGDFRRVAVFVEAVDHGQELPDHDLAGSSAIAHLLEEGRLARLPVDAQPDVHHREQQHQAKEAGDHPIEQIHLHDIGFACLCRRSRGTRITYR